MNSVEFEFSLVRGGPLFQLLRRLKLAGNHMEFLPRRVFAAIALAWLPLAILSAFEGRAWGNAVPVPFFRDIDLHVRVLVALPLFLFAEVMTFLRMLAVVPEFIGRGIVPEAERPKFDAAVTSALRLRDSTLAEVLLILIVYAFGIAYLWRQYLSLPMATWYATPVAGDRHMTTAGWWYVFVTLPLFQFILLRWCYRIAIWTRLLWQTARLNLELVPTHPDRCGGLGFLSPAIRAFSPLLGSLGILFAGAIWNRILFSGAKLAQFKLDLAIFTVIAVLLVLGPTLVFIPKLAVAKRLGLRDYGSFANTYVRDFDQKWVRGAQPAAEEPLGSADIQSLADLGNSYEFVNRMQFLPFSRGTALALAAAALAPVAPLFLTVYPLETIALRVLKMII